MEQCNRKITESRLQEVIAKNFGMLEVDRGLALGRKEGKGGKGKSGRSHARLPDGGWGKEFLFDSEEVLGEVEKGGVSGKKSGLGFGEIDKGIRYVKKTPRGQIGNLGDSRVSKRKFPTIQKAGDEGLNEFTRKKLLTPRRISVHDIHSEVRLSRNDHSY